MTDTGGQPDRFDALSGRVDGLGSRLDSMNGRLDAVNSRLDGLVVEDRDGSGKWVARRARVGVDWKTVAWVVSVITIPVVLAIIANR